jgi:hypothetical protein
MIPRKKENANSANESANSAKKNTFCILFAPLFALFAFCFS